MAYFLEHTQTRLTFSQNELVQTAILKVYGMNAFRHECLDLSYPCAILQGFIN